MQGDFTTRAGGALPPEKASVRQVGKSLPPTHKHINRIGSKSLGTRNSVSRYGADEWIDLLQVETG